MIYNSLHMMLVFKQTEQKWKHRKKDRKKDGKDTSETKTII